jgi:hypothetical protein
MPLVTVSTTDTSGRVFDVRVNDRIYTVDKNKVVTLYVEPEALTNFTAQVQGADASAVVTSRPE